ncbi:hypothetical protein MIB92_06045 [Aestuariirhabdus sp. Z084]|uniref:adenylate/guanylate cyclase domain-containing protein n=1 Tax=Aestuariirhabdus haliotis TaxID=2918751 RepID=UPI00201B4576|nr:adenylate/guanylate cyclase domain-containing protein [Aestuariirhabdus haliotis]MCL6415203.1 hypothetical protein [Aestuariirhabdus haliotis]MCL6420078.1 hypothetical protein [Aestuariirhabdus haliotis]
MDTPHTTTSIIRLPIAYRMAVAITLCTFLSLALLVSINANQQSQLLNKQISGYATTIVRQLAAAAQEPLFTDDHLSLRLTIANLTEQPDIQGVALYNEKGDLLMQQGQTSGGRLTDELRRTVNAKPKDNQLFRFRWKDNSHNELSAFIAPIRFKGVTAGYAEVAFSRIQLFGVIRSSLSSTLIVALILSGLSTLLAVVMGKHLSNPINTLVDATAQALGKARHDEQRRHTDEIAYLLDGVNEMGQAMVEKSQLEQVFSRFVSPTIASQMIESLDQVALTNKRVEATVLFADIVGFTKMSEQMDPEQVAELLNEYYGYFYKLSKYYYGTVDKFIGDAAMVIFGVPEEDSEHRFHAISYAVGLQRLVEELNIARSAKNKPGIHVRIGINCGTMQAGLLGTSERMEYTVVGDSVNLASRLCGEAEADQIVIPADIYHHPSIKERVQVKIQNAIRIRGKTEPVDTYLVTGMSDSQRQAISALIDDLIYGSQHDD